MGFIALACQKSISYGIESALFRICVLSIQNRRDISNQVWWFLPNTEQSGNHLAMMFSLWSMANLRMGLFKFDS